MAKTHGVLVFLMMIMISCTRTDSLKEEQRYPCLLNSIYQFGDSISDVGNLVREPGAEHGAFSAIARFPYGETYGEATGRCSDGLLMVDFLAMGLSLPFVNPYLDKNASFVHGVNFAVAGATALDFSFFSERNIVLPITNSSLAIQLDWFKSHLATVCNTSADCKKLLENSLFMVGEVGGNDYNYAFLQGKTIEEVQTYVPYVVQGIVDAVETVIELGAKRVMVPGNFPIGCMPMYLTAFQRDVGNSTSHQCLENFNDFAQYHNRYLFREIKRLRHKRPDVAIGYADYYYNFRALHRGAQSLGFEQLSLLKACCGTGGDYNFDPMKMCGAEGVLACANPGQFVSWDGVHLTQKAYKHMAKQIIRQLYRVMRRYEIANQL